MYTEVTFTIVHVVLVYMSPDMWCNLVNVIYINRVYNFFSRVWFTSTDFSNGKLTGINLTPCALHTEYKVSNSGLKPSFHYPSWRPELTGDRFPLPVNSGSGNWVLVSAVDQKIFILSDVSDKAETMQHHVHGKRLFKLSLNLPKLTINLLASMVSIGLVAHDIPDSSTAATSNQLLSPHLPLFIHRQQVGVNPQVGKTTRLVSELGYVPS